MFGRLDLLARRASGFLCCIDASGDGEMGLAEFGPEA
jgi:hypothetical protein